MTLQAIILILKVQKASHFLSTCELSSPVIIQISYLKQNTISLDKYEHGKVKNVVVTIIISILVLIILQSGVKIQKIQLKTLKLDPLAKLNRFFNIN